MRTIVMRLIALAAVVLALLPLYGVAAAAPTRVAGVPAVAHLQPARRLHPPFPESASPHDTGTRRHLSSPRRTMKGLNRLVDIRNHVGAAHPFSTSFVERLKAATARLAPKPNPRRAVDYGQIVSVSQGQIVVRQEPLFHVAHPFRHARSLYTSGGLVPTIERVEISPHTLVSTPGRAGRVTRRFGATAGLRRGAVVATAGSLTAHALQAVAVAELSPSKVRAVSRAEMKLGHLRTQQVRLSDPRAGHFHSLDQESAQSQNGQFEGCTPDPACAGIQFKYTDIQETFTQPNEEDQGGLTLYDDGTTKIYLQSVGYTLNVANYLFNWPMVFNASAPATMYQSQQNPLYLSVQPQQITNGSYTFAGGLGISFAANFNVTIAGSTYQTSSSAGEGIVDTTSDPAPLAGSSLDIGGASDCMSLVGLDIRDTISLASASVCIDVALQGANVGVRYTPTGAGLVDTVGNPIASPAQGSLSSTPEPLQVIPNQNNWSLGLDQFYWAPKMSLSGYLSFAATPGIGPANVQCSCLTWNSPAVQFPGYPQNIPMVDTIPDDSYARQQLVHLGGLDGPQTSSLTFSYTSAPAPTVLSYTGGTAFKTGDYIGVSATLADNQGNPVVGAPITFTLAGHSCGSTTDALGNAVSCGINVMGLSAGQYPLTVTYGGGHGYAASTTTLTISLSATSVILSYVGYTTGQADGTGSFVANVQIFDGSALNVSTPDITFLSVTFSINGQTMCTKGYSGLEPQDLFGGVLHLSCSGFLGTHPDPNTDVAFAAGAYTVTATLDQNPYFTAAPVTAPFTITKIPTSLTATGSGTAAYHGSLTLSSTLSSPDGSPSDQPVLYTLGSGAQSQSCQAQTSDSSGASSCTLSVLSLPPGTYTLAISYPGSPIWAPSSTSASVTVTKGTSTLSYTGPSSVVYHQKGVALSATLDQPNSSVNIVGQTVHFAFGSQSCDASTDIHGEADCEIGQITQDPGATLTVSYAGSDLYQGTSITPDLGITRAASALSYTGATSAVYHGALTLAGTLAEANGGSAIAGQTVHFTLGSGGDTQSCDGTTDGQGNASCTISAISLTPGSITVITSYDGSVDFQPGSVTGSVTLGKEDVHLAYTGASAADLHDGVTLSGTLAEGSDGSGPVIAYQPITMSLGSQSCQGTTDALGHASCALAITQAPGAATVAASFAGNADYNSASATAPFAVNKEETVITYAGSLHPIANGQSATLAATLTDPADQTEGESAAAPIPGETVTLALGSQSCTGTTAADGTVSCTIASVNQSTGYQTVSASFAGDGSYLPSGDTGHQVLVFSYLSGAGSFVLGDQTVAGATSSTTVTWWGSNWASTNSLTTGPAPTAFKGFAPSFSQNGAASTVPTCGATYSFDSSGGNSSAPPPASSVPPYMAVAVTSQVTASGSIITGNISKIVIVKTDPGYAPNVGHAGTGTIVATICG